MKYKEKYNDWLSFADDETKSELLAAAGNEKDVEDRFYKDLAFGTGGLRGVMGAGSNRMNKYTVGRATLASVLPSISRAASAWALRGGVTRWPR